MNADPQYQPVLFRYVENNTDFFAQDPEDAFIMERDIVHDYTPMVIMELIQLSAVHDKIICENDIDIDSIFQFVTHAVMITNNASWDGFISLYENAIRGRDISEDEKDRLIEKVNAVWGKGKPENPRGANPYGITQLSRDDYPMFKKIVDAVAEHFGITGE